MHPHARRPTYKLIAVCNEGKTIGRGEDFVCRVYRSNAKLRRKSMKGRGSKLGGKISMSGKYYPYRGFAL